MVYKGHVRNGVIVVDDDVLLPEGATVRFEIEPNARSFGERFAAFMGKAYGLPPDAAENHDHYLYGTTKK